MPGVDVEAVEAYAEAHRQELMLPIIKSNPNMPIEKITDWMLHDQALEIIFPDIAKEVHKIEYEKALLAYEKRGLGECHTCVTEDNA